MTAFPVTLPRGAWRDRSRACTLECVSSSQAGNDVERTLLQQVADGSEPAVREVLDKYGGLVWSLVRRFCSSNAEAEDAAQDIFLDVWKSAGRYDPSVAAESTFIAMIARRRLIDRRRKASRGPELRDYVEEAGVGAIDSLAHSEIELSEDAKRARDALSQLRPEQQRVLRLSIYHGLSHERIAEATGLPLGTVKTHVRRGLIKVRSILTNGDNGGGGDTGGDGPGDSVRNTGSARVRS